MQLKQEYAYYEANKEQLLKKHLGSFVLIKRTKIVGFFDSEEKAYKAGLERFGNEPFLITKVTKEEDVSQSPALVLGIL